MFDKYVIKQGDTLTSIAKIYSIDESALREANNNLNDLDLREGMELVIPKNKQEYFNIYVIEKGDSLDKIAQKYNINPTLLASLNGLDIDNYIYPGQELLIPKSGYSYYITAEGDTLDTVSNLFKISKLDLLNQNDTIYLLKDQVLVSKR